MMEPPMADTPTRLLHVTTVAMTLRFLSGHVQYARQRGMEVHAVSSPGEFLDSFAQETGAIVHGVEMARRITPFRDLRSLQQMIRVFRKVKPTIVHGHTPKGGLLAMMAARWCNVPVRVYHVHGLPLMTARGVKRFLLRRSERTSSRLATQVYAVCNSIRDVVLAEGLCPAEKIKVLNHGIIDGVDADDRFNPQRAPFTRRDVRQHYGIPADAPVIGFVGRIVRDKGVHELVSAWRVLREEFPSLHLLVVGPFESEDPVDPEVEAALRNDPRVHLTGLVLDVERMFSAMDVFALPTYREGFPVSPLEASAMELPVVATRIPGCVEAVSDGETGVLVPPRDAEALTAALRRYLADAELRARHGRQGRERVLREFLPETIRGTLYQEYLRLLREHADAHPEACVMEGATAK